MGNPVDPDGKHEMECQSCHGPMVIGSERVYDPTNRAGRARAPWYDMPTCQSCHQTANATTWLSNRSDYGTLAYNAATDKRFASNDNTPQPGISLYRFSVGHGNLQCEACHNSTHAEFTSKPSPQFAERQPARDRGAGIRGGDPRVHGMSRDGPSDQGGPHGMHTLVSPGSPPSDAVNSSNRADCLYCHGSTSAGSPWR